MNRTLVTMSKGALIAGALMMGFWATPAQAQVEIRIFPPAAFRATSRPVYYDGRASYYYQGRWYYQDRGNWEYYREEPRHLRDYRSGPRVIKVRPHYERRHRRGGHR